MDTTGSDCLNQPHESGNKIPHARGNGAAITPVYWQHQRTESYASVGNSKPTPITLEDHTEEPSEHSGALWAKSVTILDYVIVSGSRTGVGAYVVWNCRVETLDVRFALFVSSFMFT